MDAWHDVRCRVRLVNLLSTLRLQVLLVTNYATNGRPVDVVLSAVGASSFVARLSHILCFVEIISQVVDLPLIHRDLGDIFT